MLTAKQLMENSKRTQIVTIQKREALVKLAKAPKIIQDNYEEMIPKGPHGNLPLSPIIGPDYMVYTATYTSKPSKLIKKRCIPFLDENKNLKYFTIEKLAFEDYKQMGGTDFISLLDDPYFPKATQEAMRASLLMFKIENKDLPVISLKADGKPQTIYLPAQEVIHDCFEDTTYANDRDSFQLLISEVKAATDKIKYKPDVSEIKSENIVTGD